jgi:hypothetical protein
LLIAAFATLQAKVNAPAGVSAAIVAGFVMIDSNEKGGTFDPALSLPLGQADQKRTPITPP